MVGSRPLKSPIYSPELFGNIPKGPGSAHVFGSMRVTRSCSSPSSAASGIDIMRVAGTGFVGFAAFGALLRQSTALRQSIADDHLCSPLAWFKGNKQQQTSVSNIGQATATKTIQRGMICFKKGDLHAAKRPGFATERCHPGPRQDRDYVGCQWGRAAARRRTMDHAARRVAR